MRVTIDLQRCDGCGLCEDLCPEVFQITGQEARARMDVVPPDTERLCRRIAQECPATAIRIED